MSGCAPSTYLGMVVRRNEYWKAVRVAVQKLKRNTYLNVYYNTRTHYWASDPEMKSKEGDIVLIKLLDAPKTDRVKHFVKAIEFPVGNVTDPVTGKLCRGPEYLSEDLLKLAPRETEQT